MSTKKDNINYIYHKNHTHFNDQRGGHHSPITGKNHGNKNSQRLILMKLSKEDNRHVKVFGIKYIPFINF
jgi:hypothetical protein